MVKYIVKVCHGATHIKEVTCSDMSSFTKQEVVNKINLGTETFYTRSPTGKEAKVDTFICGSNYCIRTVPDETTKDNLGNLPTYSC
ncbi:hypothetical protein DSECCO2_618600 [anaerobic digester metagenome]